MLIVKKADTRRRAELFVENCVPKRFDCKRCFCGFIANGSEYAVIGYSQGKAVLRAKCPVCEYHVETVEYEPVTAKDLMDIWEEEEP